MQSQDSSHASCTVTAAVILEVHCPEHTNKGVIIVSSRVPCEGCMDGKLNWPLQAMLVFTISNAVITVFTDTFTGVSKVRTVNRLYTDYY